MGILNVFRRARTSIPHGPRAFSLLIVGHGIETTPQLPTTIAHLADGTLVFGPHDLAAAKERGDVQNVLIQPGTPPQGPLARHAISERSIVTYSTEQRGSTQLVLGPGMHDYDAVLAYVAPANHVGPWRILSDVCDCIWPAPLVLRADGDMMAKSGPLQLALASSKDKIITFHGPYVGDGLPKPENLLVPGFAFGESGAFAGVVGKVTWHTIVAEHAGAAWEQRSYYVHLDPETVMIVRAQAMLEASSVLFAAGEQIAASLRPRF